MQHYPVAVVAVAEAVVVVVGDFRVFDSNVREKPRKPGRLADGCYLKTVAKIKIKIQFLCSIFLMNFNYPSLIIVVFLAGSFVRVVQVASACGTRPRAVASAAVAAGDAVAVSVVVAVEIGMSSSVVSSSGAVTIG